MKKYFAKFLSIVLAVLIGLLPGCKKDASPTGPAGNDPGSGFVIPNEFLAMYTGNNELAALAVHNNGEVLSAITETDDSGNIVKIVGATLTLPNGDNMTVFAGEDGRPRQAVIRGTIFTYSNYTDSTVDVTIDYPDGTTTLYTGQPIDPNLISALSFQRTNAIFSDELLNTMTVASMFLTGAALVVVGIVASPIVAASLEAVAIASLISTLTAVGVTQYVTENADNLSESQQEGLMIMNNVLACPVDVVSCANVILGEVLDPAVEAAVDLIEDWTTQVDDCCVQTNGCPSEEPYYCPGDCCCCPMGAVCGPENHCVMVSGKELLSNEKLLPQDIGFPMCKPRNE